ncbi:DUF3787 domain-containing protein [Romboutsia sp. 1001216sp1]|uniref:CDIF630_02480 family spore surface protein n=1 Tax=Romboutsia TaxID=1501226 RepID=UPI000A423CBE|nr:MULTISPECIES: DUF3787 domain-containing protein [Romboutsia]MDB8792413.1 DUF3787 domain-containing protein [Romboutsia sp. 1001216sp1]MDB8795708.1 DUF3787 domain-containing protein [Romboutsia sp. 1001216sp1]MDB8798413.1 DUF3787 domain-containing protein [Romboutsia sp. 1001216sp1]MDB8800873.1 DUF3787 domain-containing protein [Romboutsia sp. 1001216sp1]MDB8803847.1 DUF3787 domain-containing protein [Romboutsia sp. 1001216sp1]
MQNEKSKALSGENNKRLKSNRPTNQESTAAWANTQELQEVTNVSIPSLNNVENAKEWVDNGSRL